MLRNTGIVFTCVLMALVHLPFPYAVRAQSNASDVRVMQVDTSHYPEVTLYVAANNASGAPVNGLTKQDFSITEDGAIVDITDFHGGGQNVVYTALVIDRSSSMNQANKLAGAKDAAKTFIAQMRPGDQTTLIAFNEKPQTLQRLTADVNNLNAQIEGLYPEGTTAIYDAIIQATDELKESSGRRVLLLLTDGQDCREPKSCQVGAKGSSHTIQEAIAYANKQGQPLFIVGLGKEGMFGKSDIHEEILQRLASETGGEYFYAPSADQLAALYNRLSSNLHQEYVLTYHSPRPFYDGTRRNIRVQVGSVASSGSYTEKHLINVQSNFFVGGALLIPLLLLFALPMMIQRFRRNSRSFVPSHNVQSIPIVHASSANNGTFTSTAPYETQQTQKTSATTSEKTTSCVVCGKPIRASANFCGSCGSKQRKA